MLDAVVVRNVMCEMVQREGAGGDGMLWNAVDARGTRVRVKR